MSTASIIGLWPSTEEFAADCGITIGHARVMKHRGSIPSTYWAAIETKAAERGFSGATAKELARLASEQRHKPTPTAAT